MESSRRLGLRAVLIGVVGAVALAERVRAAEPSSSPREAPPTRIARRESPFEREIRRFRSFPHLDRAYRMLDAGRLQEARAELMTSLGIDSEDVRARTAYLVVLNRLGDHAEVVRQADELQRRGDDSASTLIYRGLARVALGQDDEAAADFRLAASLGNAGASERSLALESAADLAIRRGRYPEALAVLDDLPISERSHGNDVRRATALEALGRLTEAAEVYRTALAAAHDDAERSRLHRSLAGLARKTRNWPEARRSLLAALDVDPSDGWLMRALGDVAQSAGVEAEAVRWYRKSLEAPGPSTDEDKYQIQMSLGHAHARLRRYDDAARSFREAARLRPSSAADISAARSLADAGRAQEAIDVLEQCLRRRPTAEVHLELGLLYARAGAAQKALPHLERAAREAVTPAQEAEILGQAGFAQHALGNYEEAKRAFEKALGLDSHQAGLHLALAEVLMGVGEFASAAGHLEQSLAIRDDPAVRRALALAKTKTGDVEEALGLYRLLLDAQAKDRDAARDLLQSMAFIEFGRGNHREAAALFLQAFDRRPSVGALVQAAESLALAREWAAAVRVNLQILDLEGTTASERAEASERLGFAYAASSQPRLAAAAFGDAIAAGRGGSSTRLALAETLYALGSWTEALTESLAARQGDRGALALSLAAQCYMHLGKPGMAIHYLRQALEAPEALDPVSRRRHFDELSHLYAETAQYSEAAEACERALALAPDAATTLRLARMRRLLGDTAGARSAIEPVDPATSPAALQAQILDERAEVEAADKQFGAAIEPLLRARAIEPSAERDYRLGQYYRELGDLESAIAHLRAAAQKAPDNNRYKESLAYARARAGHRDDATALFKEVLERDGDFLPLYKEVAYSLVSTNRSAEAAPWFRKAIDNVDLYAVRSPVDQVLLEQDLFRMRREVARLENEYDVTAQFGWHSQALPQAGAPGGVAIGAAAPAQGGLELSYQPQRIGLGPDRELQVFTRLTGWGSGAEGRQSGVAYTGGFGLRVKPLRNQNLHVALERSIAGREGPPSAWLFRGLYSWDRGYDLNPGLSRWNYSLLFADLSHFSDQRGTVFYAEGRKGVTWNLRDSVLVTPHVVFDGRWQRRSAGDALGAGLGTSFRYLFNRSRYEGPRSSLDLLLYYRAEWSTAGGAAARGEFHGWTAAGAVQF